MDALPRQFLIDLVQTPGPTGSEAPVVARWCDYIRPYADEVFTDAYGNGYAVLNPDGDPTVLLTGHADELGLMVTHIDDNGFLWVGSLGGYDAKTLAAMRVKVLAKGGALAGVIGSIPPHLQHQAMGDKELKRYKFGENIYIDIGAKNKAEAEKHVRIGDSAVLDYGFMDLNGELAVGRGLDNKIGIWAAAEALRRCAGRTDILSVEKSARTDLLSAKAGHGQNVRASKLQAKIVALATVQEEIGGYGAKMGAFRIDPQIALAVDVTQSVDHPGTDKKKWGEAKLGGGPVLAHGSACHPEVVTRLGKVARALRIDLQHEASPNWTGTDADGIYTTRAGIPSAVVGLPQRYMHSPAETVNLSDLEAIARLLSGFCLDLKRGERFVVKV